MWREDSETFRVPFHQATDWTQQPITCYKMWIVGDKLLQITWCVQTASESIEILANYGKSSSSMSERLWEICKRMSLKNMEEQNCLCVEFSQMTCLVQEDHSVFCGLYKTRASSHKTRGFNNFLCKGDKKNGGWLGVGENKEERIGEEGGALIHYLEECGA